MKRASVVLLAWWFFSWNYYWGARWGPFATFEQCNAVRTDVAGSRAFSAVESWGGASRCWDDTGAADGYTVSQL
jgi:hypothetical protein